MTRLREFTADEAIAFLARPPGLMTGLERMAYKQDRARAVEVVSRDLPESLVIATSTGFLMRVFPRSDTLTSRAFLVDAVYEEATHAFLRHVLASSDIFIDVGANIGTHTVPAAAYVGPKGTVVAIEPNPDMIERLRANLALNNLRNVSVQPVAVGEERKAFKLFCHPLHPGNGWLVAPDQVTPKMIGDLENSFRVAPEVAIIPLPGRGLKLEPDQPLDLVVHDVDCVPFRDLLLAAKGDAASVVKIDVEGAEMSVIRAAGDLWTRAAPPCVVVEYEERYAGARAELFDFFAERGWALFIVSCSDQGLPTYNRLSEPYVASQFENLYAIPPARLGHCLRNCLVFDYDHAQMRATYNPQ